MSGEANRKIFYNDRNLDLSGYKILLGGVPNLQDIATYTEAPPQDVDAGLKRLASLFRKERVEEGALAYIYIRFED